VAAGNLFHLSTNDWIDFLAGFGSVLLTFLAGAEIDPVSLRRFAWPSLAIGGAGFAAPFAGAWAFAWFVLHWHWQASQVAGVALSTTSVAVVYAVMVETGLNRTDLGKLILTACFVCDVGTVGALGVLFANYDLLLGGFLAATAVVLLLLPRLLPAVLRAVNHRAGEPEVKVPVVLLLALGGLATAAGSEAVLPAYLVGLVAAGVLQENEEVLRRVRTIAFAFLTPFFFLKAGALISLQAVLAGLGSVVLLFGVKVGAKILGVLPASRAFGIGGRQGWYTTMMMSTGLTFGSISALFGLTHGYISRAQYSVLVTVVVLTALVPTLIAQLFFFPGSTRSPGALLATERERNRNRPSVPERDAGGRAVVVVALPGAAHQAVGRGHPPAAEVECAALAACVRREGARTQRPDAVQTGRARRARAADDNRPLRAGVHAPAPRGQGDIAHPIGGRVHRHRHDGRRGAQRGAGGGREQARQDGRRAAQPRPGHPGTAGPPHGVRAAHGERQPLEVHPGSKRDGSWRSRRSRPAPGRAGRSGSSRGAGAGGGAGHDPAPWTGCRSAARRAGGRRHRGRAPGTIRPRPAPVPAWLRWRRTAGARAPNSAGGPG
jgi:Kef-type K+ transport system membrane component KefB